MTRGATPVQPPVRGDRPDPGTAIVPFHGVSGPVAVRETTQTTVVDRTRVAGPVGPFDFGPWAGADPQPRVLSVTSGSGGPSGESSPQRTPTQGAEGAGAGTTSTPGSPDLDAKIAAYEKDLRKEGLRLYKAEMGALPAKVLKNSFYALVCMQVIHPLTMFGVLPVATAGLIVPAACVIAAGMAVSGWRNASARKNAPLNDWYKRVREQEIEEGLRAKRTQPSP